MQAPVLLVATVAVVVTSLSGCGATGPSTDVKADLTSCQQIETVIGTFKSTLDESSDIGGRDPKAGYRRLPALVRETQDAASRVDSVKVSDRLQPEVGHFRFMLHNLVGGLKEMDPAVQARHAAQGSEAFSYGELAQSAEMSAFDIGMTIEAIRHKCSALRAKNG
jgi:hypothetical protein